MENEEAVVVVSVVVMFRTMWKIEEGEHMGWAKSGRGRERKGEGMR